MPVLLVQAFWRLLLQLSLRLFRLQLWLPLRLFLWLPSPLPLFLQLLPQLSLRLLFSLPLPQQLLQQLLQPLWLLFLLLFFQLRLFRPQPFLLLPALRRLWQPQLWQSLSLQGGLFSFHHLLF